MQQFKSELLCYVESLQDLKTNTKQLKRMKYVYAVHICTVCAWL